MLDACVLTNASGIRASIPKICDRIGINSFAELRSGQGVRREAENWCPRSQTARHFENRSARAQPLKTGRPGVGARYFKNRGRSSSEHCKAAGRLTREPPRLPDRILIFCERTRKPRRFLKSSGARDGASAPVRDVRSRRKLYKAERGRFSF
jgi:hypothetical protein